VCVRRTKQQAPINACTLSTKCSKCRNEMNYKWVFLFYNRQMKQTCLQRKNKTQKMSMKLKVSRYCDILFCSRLFILWCQIILNVMPSTKFGIMCSWPAANKCRLWIALYTVIFIFPFKILICHMRIYTSPQTDNHANIPPLSFYRPDALPATQPIASKHWRHYQQQS